MSGGAFGSRGKESARGPPLHRVTWGRGSGPLVSGLQHTGQPQAGWLLIIHPGLGP